VSEKRYLSTGQVARMLGVSDTYVRFRCETGVIGGAFRLPSGHWRIPREWATEILAARRVVSKRQSS
jgi:hypothetical protein